LSDDTKRVLFILDILDPMTDEEVRAAGEELVEVLKKNAPEAVVEERMLRKE
jgi:DNA/RNA-binding domain of Phe-tRNA-synthetase-like protein